MPWRSLPHAEQRAMVLDGELGSVRGFSYPVDWPMDCANRLAVVVPDFPTAVMMGVGAAWVWCASLTPPHEWEIGTSDGERIYVGLPAHFRVRDVTWVDGDIVALTSGLITSPTRTILDIARYEISYSEVDIDEILTTMTTNFPQSLDEADERLRAVAHLPYKERARIRLNRARSKVSPTLRSRDTRHRPNQFGAPH